MAYFNPRLPANSTQRSMFDLSQKQTWTQPCGMILPTDFIEVIKGDKGRIQRDTQIITQPLNSAAFARLKFTTEYFYVPYAYMWQWWEEFYAQTPYTHSDFMNIVGDVSKRNEIAESPFMTGANIFKALKQLYNDRGSSDSTGEDIFGYNRFDTAIRLLERAQLPYVEVDDPMWQNETNQKWLNCIADTKHYSAFRLMAFQAVWNKFFRNENLQKQEIQTYNVDASYRATQDGLTISQIIAMLTPRYCLWNKDLLTSLKVNIIAQDQMPKDATEQQSIWTQDFIKWTQNDLANIDGEQHNVMTEANNVFYGNGRSRNKEGVVKFQSDNFGIVIGCSYIEALSEYNAFQIDSMNLKTKPEDFYRPEFAELGMQAVPYLSLIHI